MWSARAEIWNNRDAIAHVWISDSNKPSLKEVLHHLNSDYIDSLFALSTYIVAGVALGALRETNFKSASQWFGAINRELENMWG
jgi:uncharacterized membrane protein YraQ (UPF0718 family)